jgi:DNA-binding PadR family transcriptional regulator
MSRLLIQEKPLWVLPGLAKLIGLNEAMILQQLHYWLSESKAGTTRDGERWIYNTYEEWAENFPFWSVSTIQRTFANLEKQGLIISAQLDAKKRDMRKFYRIDYAKLEELEGVKVAPHHVKLTSSHHVKMESSNVSNWHDVNIESETTTETNTDKKNTSAKNADVPPPLDWQIVAGQPIRLPTKEQEFDAAMDIAAMHICKAGADLEPLAKAFMRARGMTPATRREYKTWGAALREMKTAGVTPEAVTASVARLKKDNLTIADPWAILKTARDISTRATTEQAGHKPVIRSLD